MSHTGLCKGSQKLTNLDFCCDILLVFVTLPSYGIGKIITLTSQRCCPFLRTGDVSAGQGESGSLATVAGMTCTFPGGSHFV